MPPPRILRLVVGSVIFAALSAASAQAQADGESRLRSLPRTERDRLSAKIQEFDTLDPNEQTRIRALDARLAEMPDAERANYLAVLRRYHLWLAGLTEAERNEINAAPPEARMAVVSKIKANQVARPDAVPPILLAAADYGGVSPFDLANRIKVWFSLGGVQQAELDRLEEPARSRRLQELGRSLQVPPVARLDQSQIDRAFDRAARSAIFPLLKRPEDTLKMARFKQRLAEVTYFEANPPARVEPANLLRFSRALPVWIRTVIDPMPPDEAKRRLTVLYRLVFPAPLEMPMPGAAGAASGVPAAAPGAPAARVPAPPPTPPPPPPATPKASTPF